MATPSVGSGHVEHGEARETHGGHGLVAESHADHGHHEPHHVNYLIVFGALCVFTLLSILADVVNGFLNPDSGGAKHFGLSYAVMVVIVLAVATAKALCVMLYFMHLKFERNWKYVLLAPTIILAIGIPLALLPDVALHYYIQDVPQMKALDEEHSHGAAAEEKADEGAAFPASPTPE